MWDKIASVVMRYRVWWLLIILGLTGFMGYHASKIQLAYDMQKLVPKTDKDFITYIDFKKKFGEDGNKLIIGVQSERFWKIDYFRRFSDLCDSLATIPGVSGVVSPSKVVALKVDDSLQQFVTHPLFNKDIRTQEELDSLYQVFESLRFYDKLIFNKDSGVALCIVSIEQKVLDSEIRNALLRKAFAFCDQFASANKTTIHYSGLPFIRNEFSTKVKSEITLFTIIAFGITALLILLFFRSMTTLVISMVFIAIGVIWCLGISQLYGYKITMLIGTLPTLLVVIGVQS